MEAVKKRQGCPARIRTDKGTENGHIEQMQKIMRSNAADEFANRCYLSGSSIHNQRIEQWWGFLRKENAQYWMDFFAMMKHMGCFTGDFLDKALVQFCFVDLIQVRFLSIYSIYGQVHGRVDKSKQNIYYSIVFRYVFYHEENANV